MYNIGDIEAVGLKYYPNIEIFRQSMENIFVYKGVWGMILNPEAVENKYGFIELCKIIGLDPMPKSSTFISTLLAHGVLPVDPACECSLEKFANISGQIDIAGYFKSEAILFTDGASVNNGKVGASATYAAIMDKDYIAGSVVDRDLVLIDGRVEYGEEVIAPSNNRGELMAMFYALSLVKKFKLMSRRVKIISDSEYTIKTLTLWYKDKAGDTRLNLDIIKILYRLYKEVCTYVDLELIHVRSHQKKTQCNFCNKCDLCVMRLGNELADKKAGEVKSGGTIITPRLKNIDLLTV